MIEKQIKRNRALLTLGILGELSAGLKDPFGLASIAYKEVYGYVPFSINKANFRSTIYRSINCGDIEKIVKGNEVYLKISKKGKEKLAKYFPLVNFVKKNWDKKWRVLIYDVTEKERNKREALRRKILTLGFGKLQESVYISPFPIEKEMVLFIEHHHLSENVLFLVSETIFAGGEKYLAESVWKLSKINLEYEKLMEDIKKTKIWTEENRRKAKTMFINILSSDPFLPKELLPNEWMRDELRTAIKNLHS